MSIEDLRIRQDGDGVIVPVKVVPGSSRDKVVGLLGPCLKIGTSAPAEKGKANAAVAGTLAKALGLRRRAVELVAGATGSRKEFRVAGMDADEVLAILRKTTTAREGRPSSDGPGRGEQRRDGGG